MTKDLTIGLDIGATKMAFVVADRQGNALERHALPTRDDANASAKDTLDRLARQLNKYMSAYLDIAGIGIGVPGPVDTTNGIALNAVNLGWKNLPLRQEVAKRLTRSTPICIDNDVNVGAIGEYHLGSAREVGHYVYLSVGTGLGGAVVMNGELMRGVTHSEMEIGHVSIDPIDGRLCSCGLRGCLEMSVSGKGLISIARQQLAHYPQSPLVNDTVTTQNIIRHTEEQDPLACAVINEAANALGIAIGWCINLFNPELIVLGGGLIHAAYHLLEAGALASAKSRCLPLNYSSAKIKLSQHSDAALGASALVRLQQPLGSGVKVGRVHSK